MIRHLTASVDSVRSRAGQGLVEYALIVALIAVVVIVALQFIGGGASKP